MEKKSFFKFSHPLDENSEFFENLIDIKHGYVERIVSKAHSSPDGFWYNQENDEWVIVLQGDATIQFEEESVELQKGDYIFIPAHKKHRVSYTSSEPECIRLAIHGKINKNNV